MTTRSLTVLEAEERAALLTVDRYDIAVDLTGLADGDEFRSVSRIAFRCASPGASTYVDCAAEVIAATLNGTPIASGDIQVDGRIQLENLAAENLLVVDTVQTDVHHANGIQRTVDERDGKVYVWTSFEPDDARRAWACFDQPDLKAPHRFTVTAPSDWLVTSNSAVASVSETDSSRVWEFPDTPRLSTYVAVVNAGPFHELRRQLGGHDLGLFCRASLAPALDRDADQLFDLTARGLEFFGDKFGSPFPQEKYDQVFVPGMGGAMENWGCVTWSDAFVFPTRPTAQQEAIRTDVLYHEMAHMWFGDLVTMQWWEDLWLNEAFASWASLWATVGVTGSQEPWADFVTDEVAGYAADMAVTTHPIRQPVHDVAAAMASFDSITYIKGAAMLRQLVAYVGEDAFLAGLRLYFSRHAWGNTRLSDLMDAIAESSGRDLNGWTTDWLDRAGTDTLTLSREGAGWTLLAESPDGGRPRPHRVDIGVYTAGSGGLVRTSTTSVEVAGVRTPLPDLAEGDLRIVNDDDLTFAAVRSDPESTSLMLKDAGTLPSSLSRALAVSTAWDMLVKAELSAADMVGCALSGIGGEDSAARIQDMLLLAMNAAELWAPADDRDRLYADIADACAPLAERESLRREVLRTLARTATTDAHLDLVDAHTAGDPDLEWLYLIRLSELGRADQARVEDLESRDPDPESGISALAVRATNANLEDKETVWQAVFTERRVPSGKLMRVSKAFWQPGQRDLLGPYVTRYCDEMAAMDGGMLAVGAIAHTFFPSLLGDLALVDAAEKAATAEETSPLAASVLRQRADLQRRMLRARGAAGV